MSQLTLLLVTILTVRNIHCTAFNSNDNQLLFSNVCQSGIREDNTNYIYCARKSLTQVPIFSKNNVVYDELVLADNRITELHANSFARIKVKKIFLNGNPLRYIDQMSFKKLQNHLEELWIDGDTTISSNNLLAEPLYTTSGGLPKAIVNYLGNLNTLRIKGFLVHTLTNGIMKRLRRIEVLSLKFCSIKKIEALAFEGLHKSLRELYLDGNLMQEVPSEALLNSRFKSLKILSLSQNRIKLIEQTSFGSYLVTGNQGLNTLTKLDLSYNGLKRIHPDAFMNLNTSLEFLKLQNNEINSFNLEFLKSLSHLHELNLAFNVITSLPINTFINSATLEVLELQGNSIQFSANEPHSNINSYMAMSTTPEQSTGSVLRGLRGLQRLNMARNGIRHMPVGLFRPVYNLQSLLLDKNPIEDFAANTFLGVYQSLKNLSLQNTEMEAKDLMSLRSFEALERLKLSFNNIDELDLSVFERSHETLANLDVRKNHIKTLHESKSTMKNLVELDLSSNELCGFNAQLLSSMPKLNNLALSQNPLYCDCNLLPLYAWSTEHFDKDIISFIQWQCEVPTEALSARVTYRQFTSLGPEEFVCVNEPKCQASTTTSVTVPSTTTRVTSTVSTVDQNSEANFLKSPVIKKMARIVNVNLSTNLNTITVDWTVDTSTSVHTMSGFKITFNQPDKGTPIKSFTVAVNQRSFKLQNLSYDRKYSVCVSVIQYQGYDKYCRDIVTEAEKIPIIGSSTARSEPLSTLAVAIEPDVLMNNSAIVSGLMITVLCVLVLFIIGLVVFIYFYIKKCRATKKQRSKSLMLSSSSSTNATMNLRRPGGNSGYQGPKLITLENSKKMLEFHKGGGCSQPLPTSTSSPQSTSTISNQNCCSCLQIGNAPQVCHTMGRHFGGDTSTVSSTLSNENVNNNNNNNNNNSNTKTNPNYNNVHVFGQGQFEGVNSGEMLLRSVPQYHGGDLISSSPTSFQHFTLQNSQHVNNYAAYDSYNQVQNSNLISNNSTMHYDKLTKLNKIILNNNNNNNNNMMVMNGNNNGDHVYCEIPSSMSQTMGRMVNTINPRNPSQMIFTNYNNNLNSLHQHLVNQSLLMATSASNQQSQQNSNNFQVTPNPSHAGGNNNKFTASII